MAPLKAFLLGLLFVFPGADNASAESYSDLKDYMNNLSQKLANEFANPVSEVDLSTVDSDGDGYNDAEEEAIGSDPTNPCDLSGCVIESEESFD